MRAFLCRINVVFFVFILKFNSLYIINIGKIDQFKLVINEATTPAADEFFHAAKRDRIQILNSLAAFYVAQAKQEKDKIKRDQYFSLATQAYNKAEKVDVSDEFIYAGKGWIHSYNPQE